ncbi:hypothetical protein NBRC116590_02390 [Pelagimonas sp. KU-00592-HH]
MNKNIGRAERSGKLPREIVDPIKVGDIPRDHGGIVSDPIGPIFQRIATPRDANHLGPRPGQNGGGALPKAGTGTGHDGHPTVYVEQVGRGQRFSLPPSG